MPMPITHIPANPFALQASEAQMAAGAGFGGGLSQALVEPAMRKRQFEMSQKFPTHQEQHTQAQIRDINSLIESREAATSLAERMHIADEANREKVHAQNKRSLEFDRYHKLLLLLLGEIEDAPEIAKRQVLDNFVAMTLAAGNTDFAFINKVPINKLKSSLRDAQMKLEIEQIELERRYLEPIALARYRKMKNEALQSELTTEKQWLELGYLPREREADVSGKELANVLTDMGLKTPRYLGQGPGGYLTQEPGQDPKVTRWPSPSPEDARALAEEQKREAITNITMELIKSRGGLSDDLEEAEKELPVIIRQAEAIYRYGFPGDVGEDFDREAERTGIMRTFDKDVERTGIMRTFDTNVGTRTWRKEKIATFPRANQATVSGILDMVFGRNMPLDNPGLSRAFDSLPREVQDQLSAILREAGASSERNVFDKYSGQFILPRRSK